MAEGKIKNKLKSNQSSKKPWKHGFQTNQIFEIMELESAPAKMWRWATCCPKQRQAGRGIGLNNPWKRSLKYPWALPTVSRGQSTSHSREKPGQWIRKGRSKAKHNSSIWTVIVVWTTSKSAVGYKLRGKKKVIKESIKEQKSAELQKNSLRKENRNKKNGSCSPTATEEVILVKL